MKHFKRFLCVVLTLLLIVPGGLAEDMALALNTEETGASFEGDVSSVSANNDDGAAADEDAAFSISPVDSDVAEAGEMDLPADDGDVGALSVQADYTDAPSASTVTYCFIALDTLVASRTAAEGEEIAAPDAPAAPEGMVFAGWALEDGTALFADDTPVIAHTDPIISEINVIAKFAAAEVPAAPAVSVPSDEDTGSEEDAGAAGDASVSDNTEPVEEPGEGSAPAAADETAPVAADETEPGADDDPEADADAGTDGNGEEGGDADQEDADAANDADAEKEDESAKDAGTVNNADAEKDAEEEGNENAGALEDDPAEGEPNGDEAGNEDGDEASGEDGNEDGDEDGGEASDEAGGDAEAALQPIRVVFNITPADAVVTVKALDSEVGEAAEEQPDDAQPADETPDGTSENTDASITAQDDGSFALLPGAYTYTASAEGYKPALDVPFTVAVDALTIDIALEAEVEDSDEESADGAVAEEAQEAEEADGAEEYPPFDQSATCNGVVVSVKADAGTFPAGAALYVSRVLLYEQRQADAAVDEVRDENMTVESSYTFDIKVLDDAGNELQPADGHAVSVSFSVDTVADENLTTTIYHIEEEGGSYTAALLETVEDGDTASAETDGFSIYTVEFAYENMTYSVDGVSQTLYWILKDLGLVGEMTDVTDVNVSKPELFNAVSYGSGDWIIASYRAFSSEEWMDVTIKGHKYRIAVTFNWKPVSYIDENGQEKQISEYSLVQPSDEPITWTGWYVLDDNITIPKRITVSGEAHLILCPHKKLWAEKGITVAAGNTLNIYTQSTGEGQDVKGVLYSGISEEGAPGTPDYCAGIGGGEQGGACGTVNIIGGEIHANGGPYGAGIGGGKEGTGGRITIGGTAQVTATGGPYGAGIGGGNNGPGGRITISGGEIHAEGGQYGAGIGGGYQGAGGRITIGGTAQVTATGGPNGGAGIGGGYQGAGGNITISGDTAQVTVEANGTAGGAGIGGGKEGGDGGTVTISGGTVEATGSVNAAGIGGGWNGDGGTVTISGGWVKSAIGGQYGAGIGGGAFGDGGNITISGGTVTANGGDQGAGIGGGKDGAGGTVTISGGDVIANGGDQDATVITGGGAGIGGGDGGDGGRISISGGTVEANGGDNGAGIGGGDEGAGGTVTIGGGEVKATGGYNGAGIGGGYNGAGGNITISGDTAQVTVEANGTADGAGIGGGYSGAGGTITITGGTVNATGGEFGGAGIGGGAFGAGGTVTIRGGTVNAQGGEGSGAGIGGGIDGDGGTVTISGGTVTVRKKSTAQLIGHGGGGESLSPGSLYLSRMHAFISDVAGAGPVPGSAVLSTCQDTNNDYVRLESCTADTPCEYCNYGNSEYAYKDAQGNVFNLLTGTVVKSIDGNVSTTWPSGWYAVEKDVTINDRVRVQGTVNLILCDGTDSEDVITLTAAQGITVADGKTLNIYVGKKDAASSASDIRGNGALIAGTQGGSSDLYAGIGGDDGDGGTVNIYGGTVTAWGGHNSAGIGGGYNGAGGTVNIYGGTVNATGDAWGAGIGGGGQGTGGEVNIYGGNVTAKGGDKGAGIGGGFQSSKGVDVTISGGTVTANGGTVTDNGDSDGGAGIGGGYQGAGGTITISGGEKVTATGGDGGAGIGGGKGGAGGNITISGTANIAKAQGGRHGAGIGGGNGGAGGTITVNGGNITAYGGPTSYGAGIGGGKDKPGGDITINGGTVNATGGTYGGAGIGGGYQGDGGKIYINVGEVTANGISGGAGIGGGDKGAGGTITISGGEKVTATGGAGGAGIGGGNGKPGGDVTISGGEEVTATGGSDGAGIGGGSGGAGGTIEISGGTVNATTGKGGAGIGGGRSGAGGNITISGGTVTANGGKQGAGIGGGYQRDGGKVTISDGEVTATGGENGAGIGGGYQGAGGTIKISGTANIAEAQGGRGGAGIGGGSMDGIKKSVTIGDKITISGETTVVAKGGEDGAGIGVGSMQGASGNVSFDGTIEISGYSVKALGGERGAGIGISSRQGASGNLDFKGKIKISDGTVDATGGKYGAGIGGGDNGAGGTIEISGGVVNANSNGYGAGIGGGNGGDGGNITISGTASVTATGSDGGAGIGGGNGGAGGNITIKGTAKITNAQGGGCGAGIGGGDGKPGGNITISGTANIEEAQGGKGGAGIGGGEGGDGGNITINGKANVTTQGGENGAGIGGGYLGAGGTIEISGGTVTATGNDGGAGIGSGDDGKNGSITISGTAQVTATGGECGAGIGGGRYGQIESITIEGGTIKANGGTNAAGIGGGMAGKGDGYRVDGGKIKISDGTVNATGGEKGAGIGGGWEGAGGNITIEGGTVTAIGGTMGAGIGSGYLCQFGPSSVTISGGTVTATGNDGGAGIGAGMDSLKADIALSYSATGGVPELPKITSSSYVGDVTMSGDFCEWLDAGHYGVVFDAENANVDLYKEAMAGLTIVPCPAGAHRIDVQLLPGYGGGTPRNRAFAAMKTKTGKEIPVSKAFGGSSIALRVEAAPGCEIEYRPSRLTGSDGREIHLDRNDAFTMPDCDVSAYLTRWAWLQWAIDRAANAEGGPSITLTADVRAEKWEKALAVPKGRPVTVDLAGCSIDRNLNNAAENGGVIDVTGALTVKDGSQSRTGKITGGYTVGNGGGAYVHGGGALTLTGGAVTGNRAAQGGGVYVADGSFSVSGAPKVTGNTCNGAANNVYLPRGAVIDVAGGLESGATIGVTTASNPETDGAVTLTRGLNGRGAPTAFASDEGYNVAWSGDGQEAVLAAQETILPAKLKAYGKTSLRLSWNAVDGAEGYDVFFALCGSNTYRLAGTVTDRLSYRFRKLKRHTCYKAYVCAWRTVDGVKTYTGVESLRLHAVTGGYAHKITNPKKVTVKRKAVKLAPGGKVRMGAKVTGVRSGKKVLSHVNRLRYYSTNPTVATVDEKGRITAVSLGECTVYAVANNGIRKGTRVTVR